jgi:hypothetical protein
MHSLAFEVLHHYDLRESGIIIPVQVRHGGQAVNVSAKVDTGADNCIFTRECGERLGLDIEAGLPQYFGTATGRFLCYGHEVTLNVLGLETVSTAYFAAEEHLRRNFLGRTGWLDRVALGLVDYEGKMYLSLQWPGL